MKGFTKGKGAGKKFIPTSKKKSALKKSDVKKKGTSSWVGTLPSTDKNKSLRNKQSLDQKHSKEDIDGGRDFFYDTFGEQPQEWLQTIDEDKYPLTKKVHDNLWNHNMLGYIDWDDPDGEWKNNKEVVVLTDKDRDSFIRYWVDERKEDDYADRDVRESDKKLESTARDELSKAFGKEIDEIHGSHNAFQKFSISGWEENMKLTVVVPFTATLEQLKEVENSGWKVVSVGNGITLEKDGFKGKVR